MLIRDTSVARINYNRSRESATSHEAFQGVKATSDTALKTGDLGRSKHRQATQPNRCHSGFGPPTDLDPPVQIR